MGALQDCEPREELVAQEDGREGHRLVQHARQRLVAAGVVDGELLARLGVLAVWKVVQTKGTTEQTRERLALRLATAPSILLLHCC